MRKTGLWTLVLAITLLSGLATARAEEGTEQVRQLPGGMGRLTFDDEFNGTELNRKIWTTNYTNVIPSLQDESQIYTPDNFIVSDGTLKIRTDNRKIGNFNYTSGAMTTFGSFTQAYGYFEVRAKLPAGRGLWPAFWMLPWDKSWPPEIDVMEFLGRDPTAVYVTYHWTDPKAGKTQDGVPVNATDWTKDFHLFAVDWRPGEIVWFIDGKPVKKFVSDQVPAMPMFMLLNTTVGGDWAKAPDESTPFPSYFEIDWVRAWSYDDIPQPAKPEFRYLASTVDATVTAPGKTVTFDIGIERNVEDAFVIRADLLRVDQKQVAGTQIPVPAGATGEVRRQWTLKLADDLAPGLYALSVGLFKPDWQPIDWLVNARTILVQ